MLEFIQKYGGIYQPMFILFQNSITNTNFNLTFKINQEVYFINQTTLEISEEYYINAQKINLDLGKIIKYSNQYMKFWHYPNIHKNWLTRRKNFHGIKFIAMTEIEYPSVILDETFKSKASFFETNKTYDVTNFVYGSYIDFWKTLEIEHNFSTIFYKRKDSAWGTTKSKKYESK